MEQLGRESFGLMLRVASGERSVGEKAGHSQVQLWREWRQTDRSRLDQLLHSPRPNGEPLPIKQDAAGTAENLQFEMIETGAGFAADQIGLIVPTSLCAGEVGKLIAAKLNRENRLKPCRKWGPRRRS